MSRKSNITKKEKALHFWKAKGGAIKGTLVFMDK